MLSSAVSRRTFLVTSAAAAAVADSGARAFGSALPSHPSHPLDPLTAGEIAQIKAIVTAHAGLPERALFGWVQLNEPPKAEVAGYRTGSAFRREALVVALCAEVRTAYEMVVDLRAGSVRSKKDLGDLQPFLAGDEFDIATAVVDASERAKAALEKRGYTIPGKISERFFIDIYAPGEDPATVKNGKTIRAARCLFADKQGGVNNYGPYVEGLMVIVDLYAASVLAVYDYPGAIATRTVPQDIFDPRVLGPQKPVTNLTISPPTQSRITLDGHHVRWEGWDFRFSFNQREGLVLHQIGYNDGGTLRSICYRAAVSEMLIPYADASPGWAWREFYDGGEYGLGAVAVPFQPGRELPDNAMVLDAVVASASLEAVVEPERIFLYERENGDLFGHVQESDGRHIYARAKELVIGFVTTVGNYDYIFTWVLRQDGGFDFVAELQGLILNKTIAGATCDVCTLQERGPGVYKARADQALGTLVSAQMLGVMHQHWINLRLDFDIDGTNNAIEEYNVVRPPAGAQASPGGRALTVAHTVFGTSKEAVRELDESTSRSWVVYNPSRRSELGHAAGYEIDPLTNTFSSIPASRYGEPSSFVQRHLWVTQFDERQLYAAGWYPNQHPIDYADDLFHYAGEESVYDRDIVVWYSLGFTHVTRPEDFPIMPGERIGVSFRPRGFFARNPALGYARIYK